MAHLLEVRGGEPSLVRVAAVSVGGAMVRPVIRQPGPIDGGYRFICKHVQVFNQGGTNALRLFFSEEDYTANAHYLLIAPNQSFTGPAEIKELWLRADAATTDAAVIFYQRRG